MAGETPNFRPGILDVLRLLSSPERQLEYELRVPGISIPSELLCQWFDDSYIPDSPVFRQRFSSRELEALARFNNYFADYETLLPDPHTGIRNWLENNTWKGIMSEARQTITAFESRIQK